MSRNFNALEEEIGRLIEEAVFPGCVLLLAENGEIALHKAFGFAATLPDRIPTAVDTVYDTASLTKPLVTANLVMQLIDNGDLSLSTSLGEIFSTCPDDKAPIAVAELLAHSAGIIAWYPLFAEGSTLEEYVERIFRLPLMSPPGARTIYSCPGFIILAAIIERVSGVKYGNLAASRIFEPVGLKSASLGKPAVPLEQVAPTEDSSFTEREMTRPFGVNYKFRDGVILGETHDTNSYAVAGSAGNSGLFATAEDIFTLTEQWGPRSTLLSPESIEACGINYTPFGPQHRGLGWQLASSPDCSACAELNPDSIGHTGFTGCSVWFDRRRDFTIILMSNRLHPQIGPHDMHEARRSVCRLAIEALVK